MFLAQLKSIAAVAEAGSITKAAKILFGSQPNISRYIQLFEENYNMQLFHREKHGMSLTAEGNCVMPYIYSILECVNALDEFCKNALHEEIYYLRVVTQQFSFQVHQLSKLIQLSSDKDLRISCELLSREKILASVLSREADIGILSTSKIDSKAFLRQLTNTNLESHYLASSPVYCCLNRDHPLAREKEISPSQLSEMFFVSFDHDTFSQMKQNSRNNFFSAHSQRMICCNSIEMTQTLIHENNAFTLLNMWNMSYFANDFLSCIPLHKTEDFVRLYWIKRSEDEINFFARKFIENLEKSF